jgi:hypothetical protein
MKLRPLNTALALALTSCAWMAHAEPIVYNFSANGQLSSYMASNGPATVEGTITLNDNPTATSYGTFMNIQFLSWYFSVSPITVEYSVILDASGDVVAQNSYSPYMVGTYVYNGMQLVNMTSSFYNGDWSWSGMVTDPNSVMTTLSNDSTTGQKLSDIIDLFKVSNINNSTLYFCIPMEPVEIMPGMWYTPCSPAYFYPSSITISGGDSEPLPDADGDGINDAEPLVLIAGLETDVPNYMLPDGVTSLSQGIAAKLEESAALGVEVSSYMTAYLNELKDAGIITGKEKGKLQSAISKAKGN